MNSICRAIIDVGTNSVKLLVAEVAGSEVHPILEESHQTRLGQGSYHSHRLQPGPVANTARAVADFAAKARQLEAVSIRIVATSAARDAVNREVLTAAIDRACGLKVQILSGDQEADWTFRGVTTAPGRANAPLLLLDVGGGSTEFILGQGEQKHFAASFPLGTVRLMERLPHSDPPRPEELAACRGWLQEFLQTEVRPKLRAVLDQGAARAAAVGGTDAPRGLTGAKDKSLPFAAATELVGTGGTASILGCMEAQLETFDRERLEATRLSRERLGWHTQRLWQLPLTERRRIVGLPPNRADVILTGTAIYEAVMVEFGFQELAISTRGLRYAALMGD